MKHDRNMCSKSTGITKAKNVRNMIQKKQDTKNMMSHNFFETTMCMKLGYKYIVFELYYLIDFET
jgi:hypothetical protein